MFRGIKKVAWALTALSTMSYHATMPTGRLEKLTFTAEANPVKVP